MPRRSAWIEVAAAATALAIAAAGCDRIGAGAPAPIASDAAGLLSDEQRGRIERFHRLLLEDHDLDYRVELVRGVGDLDRHAHRRFRELAVGSRSEAARGLLLVLDADQDLVRVEVGRNLEGIFPDAFVAYVEQRQMVPYFRAGQVGEGLLAATELLVTRIQRARENGAWEAEPWAAGSAGAGARARAQLGRGRNDAFAAGRDVAASESPQGAVHAYLAAMRERNGRADLDLYSAGTRAMLAGRVLTAAQMDNVARAYRGCRRHELRLAATGTHAVVRYPAALRECAPFLIVLEGGRWRLDFETAAHAIRFGRSNAWRLDASRIGPYAFAFDDWSFDRHGFPRTDADS